MFLIAAESIALPVTSILLKTNKREKLAEHAKKVICRNPIDIIATYFTFFKIYRFRIIEIVKENMFWSQKCINEGRNWGMSF